MLCFPLSADPTALRIYSKATPQILAEIRMVNGVKKIVDVRHLNRRISKTVQMGSELLLTTNRTHTRALSVSTKLNE